MDQLSYRVTPVSKNIRCFPGANPYLTFHCANQGTILIDLAPDDKEYQSVEEEVCDQFLEKLKLSVNQ